MTKSFKRDLVFITHGKNINYTFQTKDLKNSHHSNPKDKGSFKDFMTLKFWMQKFLLDYYVIVFF